MDEEMEEGVIEVYEVVEVDFDYEYDAARFFDFTRPESEAEKRQSESWFEFATSYPPSPFVAKLFPGQDLCSENVDASSHSKYNAGLSLVDGDTDIALDTEYCDQGGAYQEERSQAFLQNVKSGKLPNTRDKSEGLFAASYKGLSFYNHLADDTKKNKIKSFAKSSLPRSSTLMKPTASQLAKQNQRRPLCDSRLQKNEGGSIAHSGVESQASKRQKLDGGLLRRIVDTKQKQPINLTHKVPKRDGAIQGMIPQAKLRLTIAREPDLETAHRAERIRSTSIKEAENPIATTRKFKARPLNRKILEAPLLPISKRNTLHVPEQVFHLKTTDRAKDHASTVTSVPICQTNKGLNKASANRILETRTKDDKSSCDSVDAPKMAAHQPVHSFKARPLDRKILTSRGDIGVFRNNKRDVTVPKAFEFQTAKRIQQNPPIELFSKLSLAGEPQPKSCAQLGLPQRTSISSKGSKENRWDSCRQDANLMHEAKEKPEKHGGKQIQMCEIGSRIGISRNFGISRQQ